MDDQELERDVKESLNVIKEITGMTPRHVQMPNGAYDQRVVSVLQSLGLEIWLWTSHPHDTAANASAHDIVRRTTDELTPGSVILWHDSGSPQAVEALLGIVAMVHRRRFRFVALDDSHASAPRTGAEAKIAEVDAATGRCEHRPRARRGQGGRTGTRGFEPSEQHQRSGPHDDRTARAPKQHSAPGSC